MGEKITVTYRISDEGWIYTESFGTAQLEGRTGFNVGVEERDGVKTLVIPEKVDGLDVYILSFPRYEEGFEALYVPDGTGIILPFAFAGCRDLKTVRVPEDIYDIADTAFYKTSVPEERLRELNAMGRCKKEQAEQAVPEEPGQDIPF